MGVGRAANPRGCSSLNEVINLVNIQVFVCYFIYSSLQLFVLLDKGSVRRGFILFLDS